MNDGSPLRIWCLLRDHLGHVKPVEECFGERAEFIHDSAWDPRAILDSAPDLVLCVNDVAYDAARCLDQARRAGIPSLVLQDGILEWRCQYENPRFGAGGGAPQHQPTFADKIACIGPSSARHLVRWGNAGKVELTGMPRLDCLFSRRVSPPHGSGRRVLVMTAKKPAFTADQMKVTLRSLRDVQKYLEGRSGIEVVWRLTKGLPAELGVRNCLETLGGKELADLIQGVDAVISTPSTAMLEAMILRRPVACLDYHNVPRFVSTAWAISAPEQIAPVVSELLQPPPAKMLFQEVCLEDSVPCDDQAALRVATLIEKLARASRTGTSDKSPTFPLALPPDLARGRTDLPLLRDLYPGQEVFQESDPRQLQIRLARAEKDNAFLKERLRGRGVGHWIELFGRKAAQSLRDRKARFN